jgi:hypothetical protein
VSAPTPKPATPMGARLEDARPVRRWREVLPVPVRALLLAAALLPAGWRAWGRWGPTPEHPAPGAALVRQWSVTTCGPAAAATLLNVYGVPWEPEGWERECAVTDDGCSLYDLEAALRRRRFDASGLKATSPRALLRVRRPFIAYLHAGHFVVVLRLVETEPAPRFETYDPTTGALWQWSAGELYARGGGHVLTARPKWRGLTPPALP